MDTFGLMVRLAEELAKSDAPIVFKGSLILKAAFKDEGVEMFRDTDGLAGDWVSGLPTLQKLCQIVGDSLSHISPTLFVAPCKELGPDKNTKLVIYGKADSSFTLELDIRSNPFCCQYTTSNGETFIGCTVQKMFADKVGTASTDLVLKECAKDLYDLCQLSYLPDFRTTETTDMLKAIGVSLGDFDAFLHQSDVLRSSYNSLRLHGYKADFDAVYDKVRCFLEPFYADVKADLVWSGRKWLAPSAS